MFAGFFIRLIFGILLFLIAAKKGYGKFFWGALGIILGPFALIGIFLYRKNVDYTKASLSGITGAVIGAAFALIGWFLVVQFPPAHLSGGNPIESATFWNILLPTISVLMGLIFFAVSLSHVLAYLRQRLLPSSLNAKMKNHRLRDAIEFF